MAIRTRYFDIGICPSPGKQKGRDSRTPVAMSQSYDEETNTITVTVYLLREGMNPPDKVYDLYLCQQGQICGCHYSADIGWVANDSGDAAFSWQWPESASCLLKLGYITGGKSGLIYTEELSGDPNEIIYPDDDIRNPECPGCGMAGEDRASIWNVPVPGERFSLSGCFDEETCIALYGANGCFPIGGVWYETTGFCGGEITEILDENARQYRVSVKGEFGTAYGTDQTLYQVGDWVALAKPGCEFPDPPYLGAPTPAVTNNNVCTLEANEYVIIPYAFEGE